MPSELNSLFNTNYKIDEQFGTVTLLTAGIHGFLLTEVAEIVDGTLTRKINKIDFCPERNIDRIIGKGKISNKSVSEDEIGVQERRTFWNFLSKTSSSTSPQKKYVHKPEKFPTWRVEKDKIQQTFAILNDKINAKNVPVYNACGDSSGSTVRSTSIHNCISWCEEILKEFLGIPEIPNKWSIVKIPYWITRRLFRRQQQNAAPIEGGN